MCNLEQASVPLPAKGATNEKEFGILTRSIFKLKIKGWAKKKSHLREKKMDAVE
jgi:hypothetical protein